MLAILQLRFLIAFRSLALAQAGRLLNGSVTCTPPSTVQTAPGERPSLEQAHAPPRLQPLGRMLDANARRACIFVLLREFLLHGYPLSTQPRKSIH